MGKNFNDKETSNETLKHYYEKKEDDTVNQFLSVMNQINDIDEKIYLAKERYNVIFGEVVETNGVSNKIEDYMLEHFESNLADEIVELMKQRNELDIQLFRIKDLYRKICACKKQLDFEDKNTQSEDKEDIKIIDVEFKEENIEMDK